MRRHRKRKYSARTIAKARLVAVSQPAGETADTETWQQTIRKHPWSSIAVGAGVGLMLGMSPKLRNSVIASLIHLTK